MLIAGALHKNKGTARRSGVHALTEAPVVQKVQPAPTHTEPSVQNLMNMVAALASKSSAADRPPRKTDDKGDRKRKFGDKGQKTKFTWNSRKCRECKYENHT